MSPDSEISQYIGSALRQSLNLLLRHSGLFLGICAVLSAIPYLVYLPLGGIKTLTYESGSIVTAERVEQGKDLALYLIQLVMFAMFSGSLCYGTIKDLRGQSVDDSQVVRAGVTMLVPVLLVSIVAIVLVAIGMFAFVIPGFVILVGLSVVVPVVVVENEGVWQSLKRSWELTEGFRWMIFGLLMVAYFLMLTTTIPMWLIFGIDDWESSTIGMIYGYATNVLFEAYYAVLIAVLYHDLRIAKDGVDANVAMTVTE